MSHSIYLSCEVSLPDSFPTPERIEDEIRLLLSHLMAERGAAYELSVTIVDDAMIREMNRDYRGKDRPTDVLSFSLVEGEGMPSLPGIVPLGDIVISYETCIRQAAEIGHGVDDEFERLLVHGLLHLFGYDHEISERDEAIMREREDELLGLLARSKKNG
jgi:probable rRNA maturation factor